MKKYPWMIAIALGLGLGLMPCTVMGKGEKPIDPATTYFNCICVNAVMAMPQNPGRSDMEAAVDQGMTACKPQYKAYVDFLTRDVLTRNAWTSLHSSVYPKMDQEVQAATRIKMADYLDSIRFIWMKRTRPEVGQ